MDREKCQFLITDIETYKIRQCTNIPSELYCGEQYCVKHIGVIKLIVEDAKRRRKDAILMGWTTDSNPDRDIDPIFENLYAE